MNHTNTPPHQKREKEQAKISERFCKVCFFQYLLHNVLVDFLYMYSGTAAVSMFFHVFRGRFCSLEACGQDKKAVK